VKEQCIFLHDEIELFERNHAIMDSSTDQIETQKFGNDASSDKPLSTKERNTLLIVIAALCKHSHINHQDRGTAIQIADLTDKLGAEVSDDTIRKILKQIPEVLGLRSK
jgi:hypothetical protein